MGGRTLPDYQAKQRRLYLEATPPARLAEDGDRFFEEGRMADALEFYLRAGCRPGLGRIRDWAIEAGDALLFQQLLRGFPEAASPEAWHRLGRRALELGKHAFHRHALATSGQQEAAPGDPPPPPGTRSGNAGQG